MPLLSHSLTLAFPQEQIQTQLAGHSGIGKQGKKEQQCRLGEWPPGRTTIEDKGKTAAEAESWEGATKQRPPSCIIFKVNIELGQNHATHVYFQVSYILFNATYIQVSFITK